MTSRYIGIEQARGQLGDLVTVAQQGTDVILTRNRRAVARLTAYQEEPMERPTLDRLAQIADALVDGRHPDLTYIGDDTVKRRVCCGAADSRSSHGAAECIASTLLESVEASDAHHHAGVRLSGHIAAELNRQWSQVSS